LRVTFTCKVSGTLLKPQT